MIGANFAHIQAENFQNVQKVRSFLKSPGVNGLIKKHFEYRGQFCIDINQMLW